MNINKFQPTPDCGPGLPARWDRARGLGVTGSEVSLSMLNASQQMFVLGVAVLRTTDVCCVITHAIAANRGVLHNQGHSLCR